MFIKIHNVILSNSLLPASIKLNSNLSQDEEAETIQKMRKENEHGINLYDFA